MCVCVTVGAKGGKFREERVHQDQGGGVEGEAESAWGYACTLKNISDIRSCTNTTSGTLPEYSYRSSTLSLLAV